jgi:hypothetical protein
MSSYVDELRDEIRRLHGVESSQSVPVKEVFSCNKMRNSKRYTKQARAWAPLMVLLLSTVLIAQTSPGAREKFENEYVAITVLRGWTVDTSGVPEVKLIHSKYVLSINPIFVHASGVVRFGGIVQGMPSVEAVRAGVEGPWGSDCAQSDNVVIITGTLEWANLYTDKSITGQGCKFPSDDQPAWFGSFFHGEGSESEYTITLAFDTSEVNALPKKGSPELNQILSDVVTMLRTFVLKPPVVISSVDPPAAPPGATVTLRGSGFNLPNYNIEVTFRDVPNNFISRPIVAPDGKTLTFEIPPSLQRVTCPQPGYIEVGENCVPAPPNQVDAYECPQPPNPSGKTANSCGVPFPPGTYQVWITGSMVHSNEVPLTVTEPKPTPVNISLIYQNYGVTPGDTVAVRGSGFTPTGNNAKIGGAVVNNIPSSDGKTLTFTAPLASGTSLYPGIWIYPASVSNSNGESNSIIFDYRQPGPSPWHCCMGTTTVQPPPKHSDQER